MLFQVHSLTEFSLSPQQLGATAVNFIQIFLESRHRIITNTTSNAIFLPKFWRRLIHTKILVTPSSHVLLWCLRLCWWLVHLTSAKYFIKGKRWCLSVQLIHLKQKMIEIEFICVGWIVDSDVPLVDEFISDSVAVIHIIDKLYNLGVFRLIQVDEWSSLWILSW